MTKISFSRIVLDGKILDGDPLWSKFNGSFVNLDLPSVEIANQIYTGHALTTWHKEWRHSDNYILGQHLALDFDTEDERSTLLSLSKDPFIAKYSSMIYTTPNHSPDKPRARALFHLDTPIYQAINYSMASRSLVWLFGTADTKCKDAARFFYGSKNCEMEYLDNVLSLDVIKKIISQYQETGTKTKKTHDSPQDVDVKKMVDSALNKAADGNRNDYGFWMSCIWADNGVPQSEAENGILMYQRAVGRGTYSEQEALASVYSAYRRTR